ncbi:Uncharacterised protein [Mycobacterium tuberculosis]|nr:Uncharacterised protein [Mycobacterium tuberculosis]
MLPILVEPAISATTSRPRNRIGSTSTPRVSSRLAPIPANGLPVSRPDREKKKRNSAKIYKMMMRSPAPLNSDVVVTTGSAIASSSMLLSSTYGITRKINPESRGATDWRFSSLVMSR